MSLAQLINDLARKAREGKPFPLVEIPKPFEMDFKTFIQGATLLKNDLGEMCVPARDLQLWLQKIYQKGFDYDVSLNG